jgi:hypothetical protein
VLLSYDTDIQMDETRIAFTVSYIADGAPLLGKEAKHRPEAEVCDC